MTASAEIINNDTQALTLALEVLHNGNVELVAASMVAILRCQSKHMAQNIALDTMAELCEILEHAANKEGQKNA